METTKIIIDVNQGEAIKLGKNKYGETTIEINPASLTASQRETLATCHTSYSAGLNIPFPQRDFSTIPKIGEATVESAQMILDAHAALTKQAAQDKKEKREREILYITSLPIDAFVAHRRWDNDRPALSNHINTEQYNRESLGNYIDDPRVSAVVEIVKKELSLRQSAWDQRMSLNAIEKEKRDKEEAEKKANALKEAKEKSSRKKNQIAAWVEKNGTDNQKKRLSVNLLPDQEIIDIIREEAFTSLVDFPRYEKLTAADIDCSCDGEYDGKKVIFDADDSATATAEQFELMEKIKTLIPAAELTLRVHTGYCDRCNDDDNVDSDDNGHVESFSIKVGLTVGEFYFTREYAV